MDDNSIITLPVAIMDNNCILTLPLAILCVILLKTFFLGHPVYFDHAEYTKPTLYCQSKSPPCMEFARTGMSEASDSSGPASRRRTRQPVQNCVWI